MSTVASSPTDPRRWTGSAVLQSELPFKAAGKSPTSHLQYSQSTFRMRTYLATLLLWSAGSIASAVCAQTCVYGDQPQIIAHTGTPVGKEKTYEGGQKNTLFHSTFA